MPTVEKPHEVTHYVCPRMLEERGKWARCCGCKPHDGCSLGKEGEKEEDSQ